MGELNAAQRSAAMALLASALSRRGFEKVQQIMEADEVLKQSAGNKPMFGKDLYYISILGTPSEKTPWMLQFGGHHLALNITIAGERGILTPSLTAAQPALYTVNGKTIRPLGQENDKAFALLNALDEAQRKQAILNYRVADLVLGPGQDGKTIQPEGLKASAMNEQHKAMLLDLIAEWAGIVHESAAAARMAEIKAGLNETWFAWSGPTTVAPGRNGTSYYRIQGPNLVIEYAPQPLGGDPYHARPHDLPRSDERLRPEGHGEMRASLAAASAMILLAATPACAHRLDEYLQATTIALEKDRIQAQIRLTPGVAVFPIVFADIDRDADGVVSAAEQRAYAERVLRDLVAQRRRQAPAAASDLIDISAEGDAAGRTRRDSTRSSRPIVPGTAAQRAAHVRESSPEPDRRLSRERPRAARSGYSDHRAAAQLRPVVLSARLHRRKRACAACCR